MPPAGGEKDSALRGHGEGFPPHVTLLFWVADMWTDGSLSPITSRALSCIRPCSSALTYAMLLLPYRTIPNRQSLHYSLSHDIRVPQVYPILHYDTLLTACRVLTSLHPHPIVRDWTAARR